MFIKLNRINKHLDGDFYLSEVRINISHIIFISENKDLKQKLTEGSINIGLNPMARFSDISFTAPVGRQTITVVGEPEIIESQINKSNKQLLRG